MCNEQNRRGPPIHVDPKFTLTLHQSSDKTAIGDCVIHRGHGGINMGGRRLHRFGPVALVVTLVLIFTIGRATSALAYSVSGKYWLANSSTWPQYRVYVDYHTLPADWRTASYNARMQWNDVGSSKQYFYYDSGSPHDLYAGFYGNTSWLALTTTTYVFSAIVDCDTKLNTYFNWTASGNHSSNSYDLQGVITHEL